MEWLARHCQKCARTSQGPCWGRKGGETMLCDVKGWSVENHYVGFGPMQLISQYKEIHLNDYSFCVWRANSCKAWRTGEHDEIQYDLQETHLNCNQRSAPLSEMNRFLSPVAFHREKNRVHTHEDAICAFEQLVMSPATQLHCGSGSWGREDQGWCTICQNVLNRRYHTCYNMKDGRGDVSSGTEAYQLKIVTSPDASTMKIHICHRFFWGGWK